MSYTEYDNSEIALALEYRRAVQELNEAMAPPSIPPRKRYAACRISKHDWLTKRQLEVARLLAWGLPNKAVAAELKISIKTVEKHRQDIYDVAGTRDTSGLTHWAIHRGIVPNRFAGFRFQGGEGI